MNRHQIIIIIVVFATTICSAQENAFKVNQLKENDKVYILSSFWKDASFYFHNPAKLQTIGFDSIYKTMVNKTLETKNDYDFFCLMQKFISLLDDGHTEFNIDAWLDKHIGYDYAPIMIEQIGQQYYIVGIDKEQEPNIPFGSEVLKINQIPIQNYLDSIIKPYTYGSTNQQKMLQILPRLAFGKQSDSLCLTIKGKQRDVYIKYNCIEEGLKSANTKIYPKFMKRMGQDAYLTDDGYLYLKPSNFVNKFILQSIIEEQDTYQKAKGIILDLRFNPGGNEDIADSLLLCFLNIDTLQTYSSVTKTANAFYAAMGYGYEKYKPYYKNLVLDTMDVDYYVKGDLPTYNQPMVVLIGSITCSAAEDFLLALKLHFPDRCTLIGMPTSGSTGAPFVRQFPEYNYLFYKICTRAPLVPDKMFENGIQPDIYFEETVEDFLSKEDKIIEIAKETINKKINAKK